MALITVNPMKSTTIGGVETLIRDIQSSYCGDKVFELFQNKPEQESFRENPAVRYLSYGSAEGQGVFRKLLTKLNQYRNINTLSECDDKNTIVLFHPNDLLYMPHRVRNSSKVVLVQTNRLDIFFARLETIVMKLLSRYVDVFTVYTEIDKNAVESKYSDWFKDVRVIPRGCKLLTALTPQQAQKKIVTLARIHEHQKNFKGLMDVMDKLPDDYLLSIYGSGPPEEEAKLDRLIANRPNVKRYAACSNVAEVLRENAIFVMTSHYEGFGQTLIEARSQGLPLVVYNNFDALSWIIKSNQNGAIIEPNDTSAFANAVRKIAEDEKLFEQMSLKALTFAKETEKEKINKLWADTLDYE